MKISLKELRKIVKSCLTEAELQTFNPTVPVILFREETRRYIENVKGLIKKHYTSSVDIQNEEDLTEKIEYATKIIDEFEVNVNKMLEAVIYTIIQK